MESLARRHHTALQVDENDVVRNKAQVLAELKRLGPGLIGHLDIDDFRVTRHGEVAVVTPSVVR